MTFKDVYSELYNTLETRILDGEYGTWDDICVEIPLDMPQFRGHTMVVWGELTDDNEKYFSISAHKTDNEGHPDEKVLTVFSESTKFTDLEVAVVSMLQQLETRLLISEKDNTIQKFRDLADKYSFKMVQDGDVFRLCAKNTDNNWARWITYSPREDTVSITGNSDHLNLWFYETRPDLTADKCLEFINELNVVFEFSDEDKFIVKDLIDPEDWQEIAKIRDAYEDERYTGDISKALDSAIKAAADRHDNLEIPLHITSPNKDAAR